MKRFSYILIFPAILVLISSCNKDLTKYNTDPKSASNVPAKTLFTQGEKSLVDYMTSTSVGRAPFRVLSQEWTENTYVYEAQYNFAAYNANNNWWNGLFGTAGTTPGVLSNLQAAKNSFSLSVPDPIALRNDLIITDILEVFAYNLLVSTYGNIPYTESLNPTVPFPKYDDAKTIYSDLLMRLDTCIAGLNTSGSSLGTADQIYKGDVTKWKKFAASIQLKMGLLIANTDPASASKAVMSAVGTGVFASSADNASMTYDPSAVGNSNPIWQALVNSGRHDFLPTNLLVNTMDSLNDPRVPLYFTKDPQGKYGIFSDFTPTIQAPAYPGTLLTYSQTEFYLAEAVEQGIAVGGTAEDHYNNAITASILFWGGSASDATAYLGQPSVNYSTAAGPWREKLGYQEWIANYNNNWDSWTDIRRLGYPNLNVVNPPIGGQGDLPLRLTYPSIESGSNATNWADAVKALPGGKDVVSAKLFWMP
jgi:hypothetical protein